jgi:hypothetical protein
VNTQPVRGDRAGLLSFHDALNLSGLSESRFRFLEREFGPCVGIRTQFFTPAEYSARQVRLLLKVEEVLSKSGRTPAEVREKIEGFLATRGKGIWTAAVTSGKGGVGKTSLAVNLAVSLGRLGARPTIVDADLGLANAHLLLDLLPRRDVRGGSAWPRNCATSTIRPTPSSSTRVRASRKRFSASCAWLTTSSSWSRRMSPPA